MDPIVHLWNVSKFFEKSRNPEVFKLRMHYTQCCRKLNGQLELPKQNFGPSAMCPQCCTPWTASNHKTRILSGRRPSKRVEKLLKASGDATTKSSSGVGSFIRKCERNIPNKMIRRCLTCSKVTTFSLNKPKRMKIQKTNTFEDSNVSLSSKKKKNRTRDRTAGLNLSASQTPEIKRSGNPQTNAHKTPVSCNLKSKSLKLKTSTPMSSKKLNLVKLKGIMNASVTPSKKNKLHTFLQELC